MHYVTSTLPTSNYWHDHGVAWMGVVLLECQCAGKLQDLAKELGCNVAQLALAWSIANTDVSTAIFGSSSLAQVIT